MTDRLKHILFLADNSLILGHRNSEWTGHGPMLEQDIALSNISLDLIGQSRYLYQHAAALAGDGATEDSLAFLRDAGDFLNNLLVEQPNGDWGKTILRQFLFSAYQYPLYQQLVDSDDRDLAGIAEKSLKEITYHLRWSSEWVIRLGQGTEESAARMNRSMSELWVYTEELYTPAPFERRVDYADIKEQWFSLINKIFAEAGLRVPVSTTMQLGGKEGLHTESLTLLLNEMQYMQRTYPGVTW